MNMKSVVEYFKEMYGFTIQYAHLPCLQVGNQKKANYLPMEVRLVKHNKFLNQVISDLILCYVQACKIVEGQRYTKRLNEKQITSLLKVTCQRPRDQEIDILQVSKICLKSTITSVPWGLLFIVVYEGTGTRYASIWFYACSSKSKVTSTINIINRKQANTKK